MVFWSPSVSASLLIVSNEAPLSMIICRSSAEISGRDAMPYCGVKTFEGLKNVSHARSSPFILHSTLRLIEFAQFPRCPNGEAFGFVSCSIDGCNTPRDGLLTRLQICRSAAFPIRNCFDFSSTFFMTGLTRTQDGPCMGLLQQRASGT